MKLELVLQYQILIFDHLRFTIVRRGLPWQYCYVFVWLYQEWEDRERERKKNVEFDLN